MSQAKAKTLLNPALAAASVFVAAASAPAPAAAPTDVDTSQWECSQCPFTDDGKLASELEVGLGRNSDASAKFGEYSGLDGDGVHGIVGGSWRQSRSDGLAWRAEVSDLGLDTRSLGFSGGRQGSYRLSLRYDELPHNVFDTTATPFENLDSPLALPAGWLRTGNTRTMSTLGTASRC
ncbi:MAG: MtrB/PioB family outer membrane beta-barrel protein [Steroidobacteraceae bacterium]